MKLIRSSAIPKLTYVEFKLVVDTAVTVADIPNLQLSYFPYNPPTVYPPKPESGLCEPQGGNYKLTWLSAVPETHFEAMKEIYVKPARN